VEETTGSVEMLRNLNRLRSDDPAERKVGVKGLSGLLDDPRVRKVFEHLYRHDSDPEVRAMAWQALAGAQPSVPAPTPPAAPKAATETPASRAASRRRVQRGKSPAGGALFLLNPRNSRLIAQWQRQTHRARRPSWRRGLMVGLLVLVIGLLWGAALPEWGDWLALRRLGVIAPGEIVGAESTGDRHRVFVQFHPADAPEEAFRWMSQQVSKSDFERLGLAAPVEVRYVPDQPDVAQLAGVTAIHTRRNLLTLAAATLMAVLVVGLIVGRLLRYSSAPARRILPGRIVASRGAEDADGDYKVTLRYRFRSPGGRMITDQWGQVRNDWRGRKLPVPGTRVMVDYRSDSTYRLL